MDLEGAMLGAVDFVIYTDFIWLILVVRLLDQLLILVIFFQRIKQLPLELVVELNTALRQCQNCIEEFESSVKTCLNA